MSLFTPPSSLMPPKTESSPRAQKISSSSCLQSRQQNRSGLRHLLHSNPDRRRIHIRVHDEERGRKKDLLASNPEKSDIGPEDRPINS
ncbi:MULTISPECIES: hypothetical protein [Asaia]|uniref:hypothetical protein n=1 Tax=Asaia TaxID=91914 RepID=UPI00137761AB|nr:MULTISPECIES: hypothetical protein [Asaia]MDL2170541.1 hypothetical protein [Asaia sp. HumB]